MVVFLDSPSQSGWLKLSGDLVAEVFQRETAALCRRTIIVIVVVVVGGRSRTNVVHDHNGCVKGVLDPVGIGRDHSLAVFDLALAATTVFVLGPDKVAVGLVQTQRTP